MSHGVPWADDQRRGGVKNVKRRSRVGIDATPTSTASRHKIYDRSIRRASTLEEQTPGLGWIKLCRATSLQSMGSQKDQPTDSPLRNQEGPTWLATVTSAPAPAPAQPPHVLKPSPKSIAQPEDIGTECGSTVPIDSQAEQMVLRAAWSVKEVGEGCNACPGVAPVSSRLSRPEQPSVTAA